MKLLSKTALIAGALAISASAGFVAGHAQADQPRMQAALADLQAAQGELRSAASNKGGHREKALELIAGAIAEVHAGIDFGRGD